MNDEAKKALAEILTKEPAALTEDEMAFLRARSSYLTPDQKAVYGVNDEAVAAEGEEEAKPAKKPAKKSEPVNE